MRHKFETVAVMVILTGFPLFNPAQTALVGVFSWPGEPTRSSCRSSSIRGVRRRGESPVDGTLGLGERERPLVEGASDDDGRGARPL